MIRVRLSLIQMVIALIGTFAGVLPLLMVPVQTVAAPTCESIFTTAFRNDWPEEKLGRLIRFPTMTIETESSNGASSFKLQMYEARDGRGQFIVVDQSVASSRSPRSLIAAALAFPTFYARFDIHAEKIETSAGVTHYRALMPTSPRLNAHLTNGVQYFDLPEYRPQLYSEEYFQSTFKKGLVPLATLGRGLDHDRLEEHLLGGLIVPPFLFARLSAYQKFTDQVAHSNLLQAAHFNRVRESSLSPPVGAVWDQLTSQLGLFVIGLASKPSVQADDISYLISIFKMYENGVRIGSQSMLGQRFKSALQNRFAEWSKVELELDRIAAPLVAAREDVSIEREAIRIISEITGSDERSIQAIWNQRPGRP